MPSLGCWNRPPPGVTRRREGCCWWVTLAGPSTLRTELPSAPGLFYLSHLYCSDAAPDHTGERLGGTPAFRSRWGASRWLPTAIFSSVARHRLLVSPAATTSPPPSSACGSFSLKSDFK